MKSFKKISIVFIFSVAILFIAGLSSSVNSDPPGIGSTINSIHHI